MQIEVRTANNIVGSESLVAQVENVVTDTLSRFSDRITHVEVHLGDESGNKHGPEDKRCMIEARLDGRKPIAVTHHAASLVIAIDGAAHKLNRLIENTLGRLRAESLRKNEQRSSEDTILTEADETKDNTDQRELPPSKPL